MSRGEKKSSDWRGRLQRVPRLRSSPMRFVEMLTPNGPEHVSGSLAVQLVYSAPGECWMWLLLCREHREFVSLPARDDEMDPAVMPRRVRNLALAFRSHRACEPGWEMPADGPVEA